MTLPLLPFNIPNFSPTPTIYEQQTSGRHDLQNEANIGKGNVVIVPQSQADLIPFSKLAERNTWNYKSEADRPTLTQVFTTRGSGVEIQDKTTSDANYNILYNQLPDDLKNDMEKYPTPLTIAFTSVLKMLADAITWQQTVKVVSNTENAINRQGQNQRYPDQSFANTVAVGKELVSYANSLLEKIGKNDPHYLEVKQFVDSVDANLKSVQGKQN